MGAKVWQSDVLLEEVILCSLVVQGLLPSECVDHEEQVEDNLLQEVDQAQLEDVLACFAENSVDSNLLQPPVILHVIAELVHVFYHFHIGGHEQTQLRVHLLDSAHAAAKVVIQQVFSLFVLFALDGGGLFLHGVDLVVLTGKPLLVLHDDAFDWFPLVDIDQLFIGVVVRCVLYFAHNQVNLRHVALGQYRARREGRTLPHGGAK